MAALGFRWAPSTADHGTGNNDALTINTVHSVGEAISARAGILKLLTCANRAHDDGTASRLRKGADEV